MLSITFFIGVFLFRSSFCFPLSKLFSTSPHRFYPRGVSALPDSSVLLTFHTVNYKKGLLHPKVDVSSLSKGDNDVYLVVRIYRKTGVVAWARALSVDSSSAKLTVLSPHRFAIVHHPHRNNFPRRGEQSLCVLFTSNGRYEKCMTVKLPNVEIYPLMVPVNETMLLMPADTIKEDLSIVPAVAWLDLNTRKVDKLLKLSVGQQHMQRFLLYGAYGDGNACFLTYKLIGDDYERGRHTLFVHCFDVRRPWSSHRSRGLVKLPRGHLPDGALEVAKGFLFVGYARAVRKPKQGLVTEAFILKLDVRTLRTVPWVEKNGRPVPRVIELPPSEEVDKEPLSDAQLRQMSFIAKGDGVAVRLWSGSYLTGKFTSRNNRIILKGRGKFSWLRPQEWLIFFGKKRLPLIKAMPVASHSTEMRNVIPKDPGYLWVGDTTVSWSGKKIIVYGMLRSPPSGKTGPPFIYDIPVPYKRM